MFLPGPNPPVIRRRPGQLRSHEGQPGQSADHLGASFPDQLHPGQLGLDRNEIGPGKLGISWKYKKSNLHYTRGITPKHASQRLGDTETSQR